MGGYGNFYDYVPNSYRYPNQVYIWGISLVTFALFFKILSCQMAPWRGLKVCDFLMKKMLFLNQLLIYIIVPKFYTLNFNAVYTHTYTYTSGKEAICNQLSEWFTQNFLQARKTQ